MAFQAFGRCRSGGEGLITPHSNTSARIQRILRAHSGSRSGRLGANVPIESMTGGNVRHLLCKCKRMEMLL